MATFWRHDMRNSFRSRPWFCAWPKRLQEGGENSGSKSPGWSVEAGYEQVQAQRSPQAENDADRLSRLENH